MKTTNLEDKLEAIFNRHNETGASKWAIEQTKQLIREQRAEEWNVIHETLHSAGLVSQAHIDKVMDSRLTELTDSNKEDK